MYVRAYVRTYVCGTYYCTVSVCVVITRVLPNLLYSHHSQLQLIDSDVVSGVLSGANHGREDPGKSDWCLRYVVT